MPETYIWLNWIFRSEEVFLEAKPLLHTSPDHLFALHLTLICVVEYITVDGMFLFSYRHLVLVGSVFEAQMLCHKFAVGQSGLCKLVATIKMQAN